MFDYRRLWRNKNIREKEPVNISTTAQPEANLLIQTHIKMF